jgi:hypothetical protein
MKGNDNSLRYLIGGMGWWQVLPDHDLSIKVVISDVNVTHGKVRYLLKPTAKDVHLSVLYWVDSDKVELCVEQAEDQ